MQNGVSVNGLTATYLYVHLVQKVQVAYGFYHNAQVKYHAKYFNG